MTVLSQASTMRAARLDAPRQTSLASVSRPEPGPHEVRVRVEGSGVCASSLPLWEGREWFQYPQSPGAPGHEGWGTVDRIGEKVDPSLLGKRVASISYQAFAEYDIASENAVVPLPAAFSTRPFPGEPLGCAMNIFRRSAIEAGQDVAVIGIGFLGALLVRLASNAGARVIAISRRPFALDVAREHGADVVVSLDDPARVIEEVKRHTAGQGCARVIECIGLQAPLDLAGELARERGRLVVAGFHQDGPRTVNMFLWNWRGLDVINAHERDPAVYVDGMRAAVAAMESGVLDPSRLYTHAFELDEVDAAFKAASARPDGFMKAWVRT